MSTLKKWQIAIVLVLTCNLVLRAGEEPKDPNSQQIKFEIRDEQKTWERTYVMRIREGRLARTYDEAAIRPTHVAEVYVQTKYVPALRQASFLKTSAGAGISTKQREFIESTVDFVRMEADSGNRLFRLYAISEADAMKMVDALIEFLDEKPKEIRLEYDRRVREAREEMAKAKGLLPGKEALLPNAKAEYDKSKENAHPFLADSEAAEQAKQAIMETGKMLDSLDVELAGIREKLKVIQEYWSQEGEWSKEALAKLQELQIIQTIELKGAEARRRAAVAIRQRENDFLELFEKRTSLESEIESLRSTIRGKEERITKYEDILANPKPDMLPPKIYENKVVIYPVKAE